MTPLRPERRSNLACGSGSHVVTKEELTDLLDGVPVGPWEMQRRDGSGTYQVLAEYDFDENKVITNIYGAASKAS